MTRGSRKQKSGRRPLAIDLFSGAGGLSLGAEQAGFDVLAAVEYDPIHAAAHAFNFPRTEVVCASAAEVSGDQMRDAIRAGWKRHGRRGKWSGELDAVFGGPPCQGFSVGGVGAASDMRNEMVFEFARLVGELQPRYFVMENVPGLQGSPDPEFEGKVLLDRLIFSLEFVGYSVAKPVVLNAAMFGVPQDRRRLFLVGALDGNDLPVVPAPTVRPVPKRRSDRVRTGYFGHPDADPKLPKGPTVDEAIADLPDADQFDELWKADKCALPNDLAKAAAARASTYAKRLRGLERDPEDRSHPRTWDAAQLTASMRTGHHLQPRQRMHETEPGDFEPKSRLYRLDGEGLCGTLRAGSGYDRGSYTAPRPIHPHHPRVVTVREAARLHSFPDWFRFHPTKWHGFRQVGNALPPLMGRAIAAAVVRALSLTPRRPQVAWRLGDESLLSAEMLAAADHFGADPKAIPGNHLRGRSAPASVKSAA